MFTINLKSSIATVAVIAGVLAPSASASVSSSPVAPARAITMLDYELKGDSNEVAVEGVTAKAGLQVPQRHGLRDRVHGLHRRLPPRLVTRD